MHYLHIIQDEIQKCVKTKYSSHTAGLKWHISNRRFLSKKWEYARGVKVALERDMLMETRKGVALSYAPAQTAI